PDSHAITYQQFQNLYGSRQTNVSFNPCGWMFVDCTIVTPVPDPLAYVDFLITNQLTVDAHGFCFGFSYTSQQLASLHISRPASPPRGAKSVWELDGDNGPSTALEDHIATWHTAQFSWDFLRYWLAAASSNVSNAGRGSLQTLKTLLSEGENPIVAIR